MAEASQYGVGHEQFLWDLRTEPTIVDQFAKIWGTEALLSGFDGLNFSLVLSLGLRWMKVLIECR